MARKLLYFVLPVFFMMTLETSVSADEAMNAALDGLLFNPFCERRSVRSILNVCQPPLAVKQDNVFGTDLYSSYSTTDQTKKGTLKLPNNVASTNTYAFFLTRASIGNTIAKCSTTDSSFGSTKFKIFKIPGNGKNLYQDNLQNVNTLSFVLTSNDKGIVIIYEGANVQFECNWFQN